MTAARNDATNATPHAMPCILDEAPDFEANTTRGALRLGDTTGKGKWVMLFSYPADFTPVCGSEIVSLARRQKEFESRNVQLLGLSVDGLDAHAAWARDMERHNGVEIGFPVIADPTQRIARLYGMVHEAFSGAVTIRAVFVIDPSRKIRAILYYPAQMGRSVDELLRIVDALQTIDRNGGFLPCDWVPGQPAIPAAPAANE